jgi:putative methyltransferase (TIGR04325 family)
MTLTSLAHYILPPIVVDAARWGFARWRRLPLETGHVSTHYTLVSEWPSAREGTGTWDVDVAPRSVEWELAVPVVRDNLDALRLIPLPDATLLDFGCGNGHYHAILAACAETARWTYVGVDVRPACVQFCRQTYPTTSFETVKDDRLLPFADSAFDIVLASGVLQYIQHVEVPLAELYRVTREYVLVSRLPTWKYHGPQIVVQWLRGAFGEARSPLHVFHRALLEERFAQAGFAVIMRDYGSEVFFLSGIREPVAHVWYLLRKIPPTRPG